MNKFDFRLSVLALSLCSVWSASAQQVTQPTAPVRTATNTLEEIVVTAQHRPENVQKAAVAITVLSGDLLGEKGLGSSKDLIQSIPGLALTSATPNANLSLRGVGSGGGNAYADPTVSYNLGDVNIARQFTTASSFYDLQRVEVLKGPQGTLYGRNATVGAINIVPNRPSSKYEGSVGVDMGNYRAFAITGMVNVPISDTVAIRVAFRTSKHDGYLSNGYNDEDRRAARFSALVKPSSDLSMLFSADYFHDGGKGPSTIFLYPNNNNSRYQDSSNPWLAFSVPGCGNTQICPTYGDGNSGQGPQLASIRAMPVVGGDGFVDNQQVVLKNETEINLNAGTLTIIPAYVHSKINFKAYGQGFQQIVKDDVAQTSLEARLASNTAGPWKWILGGYLFSETQNNYALFLEANGYQINRQPNLEDKSYAIFGQATYSITDKFRVTSGLRYTRENKKQDGYTVFDEANVAVSTACTPAILAANRGTSIVAPNPLQPGGGCNVPNSGNMTFNATNFKVALEYDIAPQSMVYADVSSGFKAGGFWIGLPPNTYKPEKLTAFSIGSKNRFFENRLQANLELFYWDYKDQQVSVFTSLNPTGTAARPFNTDSYIKGAEIDLTWLPTDADKFTMDLLLEEGKYKAFPLGTNLLTQSVNNYAADMPRLNTPHASATLGYGHTFDMSNGGSVTFAARSHIQTPAWLSALANPTVPGAVLHLNGAAQKAYHVSNLSLSYYDPKGKWQVTGYIDNVENEAVVYTGTAGTISRGILYRPANTNSLYAALNAPRTWGVRFSAKF